MFGLYRESVCEIYWHEQDVWTTLTSFYYISAFLIGRA